MICTLEYKKEVKVWRGEVARWRGGEVARWERKRQKMRDLFDLERKKRERKGCRWENVGMVAYNRN